MPKLRQTCTRCSMRRQKCDRKQPCTRCIRDNEGGSCSREWRDGYDPRIHRNYPKSQRTPLNSRNEVVMHHRGNRESSSPQEAFSSQPASRQTGSVANSTFVNDAPSCLVVLPSPVHPGDSLETGVRTSNLDQPREPLATDTNVETITLEDHHCQIYGDIGSSDAVKVSLQTLIPTSRQVLRLAEYHQSHLLWFHGCVHGPTFWGEVTRAVQASDGLQIKNLDLRWCALLFATMAASLTCVNDEFAYIWGFTKAQKRLLSKQWYEATISCLHLGKYTSKPHVYSIQAIQVASISAHNIGFSSKQFILYGTALRIAQSLGLQRLALNPDLDDPVVVYAGASQSRRDLLLNRETGRRIWSQLCAHDWLSIPPLGMYLLNKQHFTTPKPRRINDETMLLADDQIPLGTDFGNYMYDIASLMAEFHDSITALENATAQYEQVLKYDVRMRALGIESLPPSFFINSLEPSRLPWIGWARGVARILHAHKTIMIHRSFLSRSFTDPRYVYSRWASIEASKAIIEEVEASFTHSETPALWSCQAHLVGAGITLCLDLLNRSETEPEFAGHRKLVDQAVALLSRYNDSILASKGTQLLSSLLMGGKSKRAQARQPSHKDNETNAQAQETDPMAWPLEDRRSVDAMRVHRQAGSHSDNLLLASSVPFSTQRGLKSNLTTPGTEHASLLDVPQQQLGQSQFINADGAFNTEVNGEMALDMSWVELFSEYFPVQSGFDETFLIEDLFG